MRTRTASDKVIPLSNAISDYVTPGCHVSIGGFTINRNPMAAVHEIIRQKINKLHLYAHSNGQGVDELIGAGCVTRLEIAYAGNGLFSSTCIRFKKAVQNGDLAVEDYSNFQMTLRFMAGAMGVPFLPTRSGLGSDIIRRWGFDPELRQNDPRLAGKKIHIMDNPFNMSAKTDNIVLVPAITPDVTIIHTQQAEKGGTARINGLTFADVEQVKAARHVIITCERLLENGALRDCSDHNQIPPFCVDAVVPVSMGAYPTACYGCYDYDPSYLKRYADAAQDDLSFRHHLQTHIYETKDHQELIALQPFENITVLAADPDKGYAPGLDRRL